MAAHTQDERSFDERYRLWAGRSGELFAEASRYIPGGAGSSARTIKFGWKPYPPFMAEGLGSRLRDACPSGVDLYFDNVGGEILDAVLTNLAMHAREDFLGRFEE